jgi:hypothetical protein
MIKGGLRAALFRSLTVNRVSTLCARHCKKSAKLMQWGL